jgi:DNA-binding protein
MSKDIPENTVFVGRKPAMTYVMSVSVLFEKLKSGKIGEILLKARGKSISKCVDVALISKNRMVQGLELGDIKIWTETKEVNEQIIERNGVKEVIALKEPKTLNKSAMEIKFTLRKGLKDGIG